MSTSSFPDLNYQQALKKLDEAMVKCSEVSNRFANIEALTSKHYYASILFTSLCTKLYSLLTILPKNRFAKHTIDHWDYSSVFCLTRSITECYFMFYYISIEEIDDEEWHCRLHLLNLHDALARKKLLGLPEKEINEIIQSIKDKLNMNFYFSSLESKHQNNLLKGDRAYLFNMTEIAKRIGIEDKDFKRMYKLLSQAVHSLPVSFYQMGKQERGRGVHSIIEEGYTKLCIMWLLDIYDEASNQMENIFNCPAT